MTAEQAHVHATAAATGCCYGLSIDDATGGPDRASAKNARLRHSPEGPSTKPTRQLPWEARRNDRERGRVLPVLGGLPLTACSLLHRGRAWVSSGPVLVEQLAAVLQRLLDLPYPVVSSLVRPSKDSDKPNTNRTDPTGLAAGLGLRSRRPGLRL